MMQTTTQSEAFSGEFLAALAGTEQFLTNPEFLNLGGTPNPNIVDDTGLVSYLNVGTNPPPPELVEMQRQISTVLEGLLGLTVATVLKMAGNDERRRHDPALWTEIAERGLSPFLNGISTSGKVFNKDVRGIDIATNFINFLLDAVVSQGEDLPKLNNFLRYQGEAIRIHAGRSEAYEYAVISIVHEMFQLGGNWVYVPKIKFCFTLLNRANFPVTNSCMSADTVRMNFQVRTVTAAFRLETWKTNPEWRRQLDQFLERFIKADIVESDNYFEGVFQSHLSA